MSPDGRATEERDSVGRLTRGAVLGLALLASCSSLPVVPYPAGVTPPLTIAVLPLDNQTNSVRGAHKVRDILNRNLDRKGYVAVPLSKVDQLLSDRFGISLGGQITDELIPEIGKTLEVDAVITGTVMAYGRFGPKELEVTVKLSETRTGKKLWDHYGWGHTEIKTWSDKNGTHTEVTQNPIDEYFGKLFAAMPNGAAPPAEARFGF